MEWTQIGKRIRRQREFLGYTREQLAELLDVTPKFCADMELGVKGMSVQTLCRLAETLHLSADYILWGRGQEEGEDGVSQILRNCSREERAYAEQMLKLFLMAMNRKNGPL